MPKLRQLALAALLPPFLTLSAHAQAGELLTAGTASVSLVPTRATVALTVATRARSAAEAATRNADRVKAVMAAMSGKGRLLDSLRVTRIDVSVHQDYETGKVHGYEAEASIEGVVRNLERVGEVLDAGLAAGATSVGGIRYHSDSLDAGRARALELAFASARADALTLARTSGRRLGALRTLSNSAPRFPFGGGAFGVEEVSVMAAGYVSPRSVLNPSPAEVQVTASVVARWQLE
jgi:uncharacterized protein YggE